LHPHWREEVVVLHRYPDPNVYIPPLNPAVTMPTGLRALLAL
jgi:hypothetical protein